MPDAVVLEKPLAIVGREDTVVGFQALGFKVYAAEGHQGLRAIFEEVIRNRCAICLVEEYIYLQAEEEIKSYKELQLPIFIPLSKDTTNLLLESIIKDIKLRATGTN